MAWSFSAKAGSLDSLKARQRCGARPWAFQIFCTVATPSPTAFAMARAVQCVASCGGGSWVSRTRSATRTSATGALPGGRVLSSSSPSTPASAKRSCQRQTVVFDLPVAAMTPFVPTPSAVRRMIRARHACFCERVAIRDDGLQTPAIGGRNRDGDPFAHAADSHARTPKGIPVRTLLFRSIH